MALINRSSFDNLSVRYSKREIAARSALHGLDNISKMLSTPTLMRASSVEYTLSSDKRGLALKSIKLTTGFEGLLQNVFNPTNEVYFLAWVWDMSNNPVTVYPGVRPDSQNCIIPLAVGKVREFIHAGISLFPPRNITAGLAIRIHIWESDQGARDFGKAMQKVSDTIKNSDLNNLLSLIAASTGVKGATLTLIKDAAIELSATIGNLLESNGDDYVDFFEGYYPASELWSDGQEIHEGYASEIALTRIS